MKRPALKPELLAHHIVNTTAGRHVDLFQRRPVFPWSLVLMTGALAAIIIFLLWEILP